MDNKQIATEIRTAIKKGDVDRVSALIGSDKARLEMTTVFGTWLHVAASHGKLDIVKRLVALGADINRSGGLSGGTPLNEAASEGHTDVVEFLLSRGALMDVSEPERNPLFSAILGGHAAVARMLIDRGIDTHVNYTGESMKDMDALKFAHRCGRSDIAKLLTSGATSSRKALHSDEPNDLSQEVISFFNKHFGPVQPLAFVEILPSEPPIAVHVIPASSERNHLTLFTTGLSLRPMAVPPGKDDYRFAELFIQLPSDWPFTNEALTNPDVNWPIHWLRAIAKYPCQHNTWLCHPITILTNGNPPEPLSPQNPFTCILLMSQYELLSREAKRIHLYRLLPLYTEERNLEVTEGLPALMDAFARSGMPLIVDLKRQNAAGG